MPIINYISQYKFTENAASIDYFSLSTAHSPIVGLTVLSIAHGKAKNEAIGIHYQKLASLIMLSKVKRVKPGQMNFANLYLYALRKILPDDQVQEIC